MGVMEEVLASFSSNMPVPQADKPNNRAHFIQMIIKMECAMPMSQWARTLCFHHPSGNLQHSVLYSICIHHTGGACHNPHCHWLSPTHFPCYFHWMNQSQALAATLVVAAHSVLCIVIQVGICAQSPFPIHLVYILPCLYILFLTLNIN